MTTATQPDLFGALDAAEQTRALYGQPWTCPSCGKTEPSGHILQLNHGYTPEDVRDGRGIYDFPRGQHPIYRAMCTSQYLRRNHVIWAARTNPSHLPEVMQAAREAGLDADAIVEYARAHLSSEEGTA